MDLEAEVLLSLVVEADELEGTGFGHGERVEDMVAALDGEVGADGAGLLHGERGAVNAVELRLKVAVGEEEERELLRGGRRWAELCAGGENRSGG